MEFVDDGGLCFAGFEGVGFVRGGKERVNGEVAAN